MTSQKIKISAVNYLNSKPFIYGLGHSGIMEEIELSLDIPSMCADKLVKNQIDIGLVPVAIIPELEEYYIISKYCIGADGNVGSVLLLSDVPLQEINTILLDNQSRTSVLLAQILAAKYWKIKPQWANATNQFETLINGTTAGVVIGDRTFALKNNFKYEYDLSGEWKKFTGLPFVFACWVANRKLPENFIQRLDAAFKSGIDNKEKVVNEFRDQYASVDIEDYFENKISFLFDDQKKKSLNLFLSYVDEISESVPVKIG